MTASTPMLIAREKAREAIESVHAARDTGEFAWTTILNVADGGVFLNGAQPVRRPGIDGLVNTADDGAIETMNKPGADGILGDCRRRSRDAQRLHAPDRHRATQLSTARRR